MRSGNAIPQDELIIFLLSGWVLLLVYDYELICQCTILSDQIPEKISSGIHHLVFDYAMLVRVLFLVLYWLFQVSWQSRSISSLQLPGKNNRNSLLIRFVSLVSILCFVLIEILPAESFLYPVTILLSLVSIHHFSTNIYYKIRNDVKILNPAKRISNRFSFHLKLDKGYINILNPFRGILVIGGPGSGKTYSVTNPIIDQALQKGYTGIVYDYKFPSLANQIHGAFYHHKICKKLRYYVINFTDLRKTHRVNPIHPRYLPSISYAEEYSRTIIQNLHTQSIQRLGFFELSAIAWLTAIIWFLRQRYPEYCTLPHAISMALYSDHIKVIETLESEPQCADLISSISTAVKHKAEKQLAGVIASLQILLSRINSPEIAWVLSGNDFDLNLNHPDTPGILCIGADPKIIETVSPVISLIISSALKQMNQPGRLPSLVLLEEAATLYIPKLEVIPATARSNKIATMLVAQDIHQLIDAYGKEKAQVIMANLGNQIYGKVNSPQTAQYISDLVGKQERMMESKSVGMNPWGRSSNNSSYHLQEKVIIQPNEIMQLGTGEFVGKVVEGPKDYFMGRIKVKKEGIFELEDFMDYDLENTINSNIRVIGKEINGMLLR